MILVFVLSSANVVMCFHIIDMFNKDTYKHTLYHVTLTSMCLLNCVQYFLQSNPN